MLGNLLVHLVTTTLSRVKNAVQKILIIWHWCMCF